MIKAIKAWWSKLPFSKEQRGERSKAQFLQDYRDFATGLGDGISYCYLGSPVMEYKGERLSLIEQFVVLDEFEEKYADMGYRIVPIDRWVGYGGYGQSIDDVWLVPREHGERPIFTKNSTKFPECAAPSPMLKLMQEHPDKAVEGFKNDEGEMEFRVVE